MPLDYGLLGGFAEGLKSGVQSYQQARQDKRRQEQEAADRALRAQQFETEQDWKNKNWELEKEKLKSEQGFKERELGIKAKEANVKTAGLLNDPYQRMPKMDQQLAEEEVKLYSKRQGAVDKLGAAMTQLEDPKISDDQKVVIGQGVLKLLNDPEASDAIGKDEAERIGAYLQQFSLSRPGSTFGRDLPRFSAQVKNKLELVKNIQNQSKERLQQKGLLQSVGSGPSEDPQIAAWARQHGLGYAQAAAIIQQRQGTAKR
jgi:hypothetical protein